MFLGIEDDDAEVYDSRESALERARMLAHLHGGLKIMEQRRFAPNWLAALVRYTPLDFLAFVEVK